MVCIPVYTTVVMQIQPINEETKKPLPLLSITELHRNVGKIFDELPKVGGYTVVRDSKAIAQIIPMKTAPKAQTMAEKLALVDKLSGGLRLKKDRSPEEMNRDYDKIYDKMLPR